MKFYAPKYKQLDLGLLRSSLDELDKTNRCVALGDLLPRTELEQEYNSRVDNQKKGAGNKPARMILGAMIKESRIPSPIQISIIASVSRPNMPNHPILSVEQPRN